MQKASIAREEEKRREEKRREEKRREEKRKAEQPVENKLWQYVFIALTAVIFLCMALLAPNIGCTGDEFLDGENGKASLNYYTEGDTTFADYSQDSILHNFVHMKYYGVGFEIVPAFLIKYVPAAAHYEYEIRHIYCAFFGFLIILFTGLTAKLIVNWRTGIIAMLLVTLTPTLFGLSFLDTKDIPFAAGFAIASYGFLSLFKNLPKFRFKDIIFSTLGLALAVSIRIGGLMLCLFFLVAFFLYVVCSKNNRQAFFKNEHNFLWKSLGIGTLIIFCGCLLGLCFYPNFFHEGPVAHVKNAITLVSKFPQRISMLFEGEIISSLDLPPHYLLKSFGYTLPIFIFLGIILFFANLRPIIKKYDMRAIGYLLFALLFPLIYIIRSKANVYNGWRHELFIYSNAIVLISIGFHEVSNWFRKMKWGTVYSWCTAGIFAIMLLPTVLWMCHNYRYCYTYYNFFVTKPHLNFDLDYYQTAQVSAFKWLYDNELQNRSDTVLVNSSNNNVCYYANSKQYPNVKAQYWSCSAFAASPCDYSIIDIHWMPKSIIKSFFPPKGTIHVETINDIPVCAVVKRNHLDSKGIELVNKQKFAEGLALLDSAQRYDPNNCGIYLYLGFAYYQLMQAEKAIEAFKKVPEAWANGADYKQALYFQGIAHYSLKQYTEAISVLQTALMRNPEQRSNIEMYLGMCHFELQQYAEALPHLEAAVGDHGFLQNAVNTCRAHAGK